MRNSNAIHEPSFDATRTGVYVSKYARKTAVYLWCHDDLCLFTLYRYFDVRRPPPAYGREFYSHYTTRVFFSAFLLRSFASNGRRDERLGILR